MRRKRSKHTVFNFVLLLLSTAGLLFIVITMLTEDGSGSRSVQTSAFATPEPDGLPSDEAKAPPLPPSPTASPPPAPTPEPTPVYQEATLIAVGDIMMHKPQIPGAYDKVKKRYDFSEYFKQVTPLFEQGDWVMANLETPIAGASYGYTGYPSFNAPIELLDALDDAGVNILTNANNHVLDKGEKGLLRTLEHLKQYSFAIKGSAASREEADANVIVERNGIKMGILAYTYGTNGIPIPEGKPYMVNMIDENKIIADIKKTKEAGADLVTIALHFGTEYQTQPNEEQKRLSRKLIAEGADIIAGSHPHVIQPYEVLQATDGKGGTRQGLIIYSLGNFISNQRDNTKDYGVIFKVHIRKNATNGTVELKEITSIPTWVHRYQPDRNYRYRILPVEQTIKDSSDSLLTAADYKSLKTHLALLRNRLESMR
ncbi:CapA family protein [Paenibacillus sp. NPDC058071]|uniref:CapA family protein n=1 Tax=Paenibacillus sp. NPDC058071 TaxID=3346326 RepID=UPI0036D7A273